MVGLNSPAGPAIQKIMMILKKIALGFVSGLLIGWLWGALEATGLLVVYFCGELSRSGALPPFSAIDLAGILLMAAAVYALVLAFFGALASPFMGLVLPRLPFRLALNRGWEVSCAACLSGAFFFSLYWWTRPLLFYGLRFYDPKRIVAAAFLAGLSILAAVAMVKLCAKTAARVTARSGAAAFFVLLAFSPAVLFFIRERSIESGSAPPVRQGEEMRPNVVLLVPDALRADHLGPYGYDPYDRPVSPFLDSLAKESVLFEHAVTQAPYTWTSFGSFLTGKFPRKHGLLKMDPKQRLDLKDNFTLAEILKEQGYTCGAFLMGTISNNSGLLQGFDVYFEARIGHDPVSVHSKWSIFKSDLILMRLFNKLKQARDPALVNSLAIDFIHRMKDRPFFLMVHYYATHTPYDPPEPYKSMYDPGYDGPFDVFTQNHNFAVVDGRLPMNDSDLRHIKALYDGGVTFEDAMAGELYAGLKEAGILDRTLLIFTSDHGEELYDHRVFEHDWMFNTNLLVPLIIRFPGGAYGGRRVSEPVSLIDLVPTVAEVARFALPEEVAAEVDGVSLLGAVRDRGMEKRPPVYAFGENNRYIQVQDGSYKLVRYRWTDREEPERLYHIAEDPGEKVNVMGRCPDVYKRLSRVLDEYDQSMPRIMKTYEEDPELYKRLFELGYIQGTNPVLEGDLGREEER